MTTRKFTIQIDRERSGHFYLTRCGKRTQDITLARAYQHRYELTRQYGGLIRAGRARIVELIP